MLERTRLLQMEGYLLALAGGAWTSLTPDPSRWLGLVALALGLWLSETRRVRLTIDAIDQERTLAEALRALELLRREHSRLAAVLDSLNDAVLTASADGRISYANRPARVLLAPGALEGTSSHHLEAASLEGHDLRALPFGDTLSPLVSASLTDGALSQEIRTESTNLLLSTFPLTSSPPGGELLLILRDITSLKQLEAARSQFLGNVSHELKTPLTIIKGFVVTLAKSEGLLDEHRRYLDFIDKETDRLSRLVDDLLDLARLRSARTQMRFTFCDPAERLTEIYRQLEPQAARYASGLSLALQGTLPTIIADPDRFTEIVLNLVDNALKYTPPQSTVEIAAHASEEYLHLRISDRGPGIAREDIPYVFERFFRGTNRAGRKSGGTGIGLAIVKEIVEAHHGHIEVESPAGQGTSFHVALPLRQATRPRGGQSPQDPPLGGPLPTRREGAPSPSR